ncbi:MAG TPA: malto-oligosyltrehalose synthase [Verrucomicrobiae bacterium]|nr:malto-oligosyltrehalose synthase [Verrucomicrobiae bacterium]
MVPGAVYRVQLNAGFTFTDAARVVPYLAQLGITHLYCSPALQAVPGSTHGYDVVDHARLNRELGGTVGYRVLVRSLHRAGLGQVLDIVPNHMATVAASNSWWWDVLESGPDSPYAAHFDIEWRRDPEGDQAWVMVPLLDDHYGRVLEAGAIRLARREGRLTVVYREHELPLAPPTVAELLEAVAQRVQDRELQSLARAYRALAAPSPRSTGSERALGRRQQAGRRRLTALVQGDPATAAALDAVMAAISSDPDRLDPLLRQQHYRLVFWRTASQELGYRRFFTIDSLIGLRVEDEDVFRDTHRLVLSLVGTGAVDGLRIDHIDGLRDPHQYLDRLRRESHGVYTVVEKILQPEEQLPAEWPVEGTSGYDFLACVSNLFVASANEAAMTTCYQEFTGELGSYRDVVYAAKQQVIANDLASEVNRLTRLLVRICDGHRRHRDHTRRDLQLALAELLAAYPVYRTYLQPGVPPSAADRRHVEQAVREAHVHRSDLDSELLSFLGELAMLAHPGAAEIDFGLRLAQVTGPVMAKAVEDTAFYRYHRLVSLNEVGGAPDVFGRPVHDFHLRMERAARNWPASLITLATHDTKRSADVRARIHLLSEIPETWATAVARFAATTKRHRRGEWPDRNAEYLFYQTLVGGWPISPERACAYMAKATKEAKLHTSWVDPNAAYDDALAEFVHRVLADRGFVAEVVSFLRANRIVELGQVTSLVQVALLLTCPGVPDIYQGSELWDTSLVDPDNRRPVDYAQRARLLRQLASDPPVEPLRERTPGRAKLWLTAQLLRHRRTHPDLHRSHEYGRLAAQGAYAAHVVAFCREPHVVIAPRLLVGLRVGWQDTCVPLPAGRWTDVVTGAARAGGSARVGELLAGFPVAVLCRATA